MVIVICDNEQKNRQKLYNYLDAVNQKKVLFHVKEYESGEQLLHDLKNGNKFDVIFFGVESDNQNIVKKIRQADSNVPIIFTANDHEQVSYAFEVEAFHYLTRPVSFKAFSSTLERAFRRCYEKKKVFKIEWKKQVKAILLKNIIYIECYNRHIAVQTETELFESYQPFQEIVQKLLPVGFIRVHQSFLVNLAHIKEIGKREITCTNGMVIPVSIRREKEVIEQFRSYLQEFTV